MALTTTAQVKAFLNKADSDTTQDNWLDALRIAAEAEIKTYCARDFEKADYLEIYSGNGQSRLPLRQYPVTAVRNVWLDFGAYYGQAPGAFADVTKLAVGVDWALELDKVPPWQVAPVSFSGNLLRLHWVWAEVGRTYYPGKLSSDTGPAWGCIKVDYTAGYPPNYIPQDLQVAVAMLCSIWRRILPLGGWVIQEKIGEYMYKLQHLINMQNMYPEIGTLFQALNRFKDVNL